MAARYTLLAAMFGLLGHWYISYWGVAAFPNPAFLTDLALYLTILQQCLSVFLHYQGAGLANPWLNTAAAHHYLFEIAFPMNLIVTTLYWTLLHSGYAANPIYQGTMLGTQIRIIHAVPFAVFLVSWFISDVVMPGRHIWRLIPYAFVWLFGNYLFVMFIRDDIGKPAYWFLDWNADFIGALRFGLGVAAVITGVFYMLAGLTYWVKSSFVAQTEADKKQVAQDDELGEGELVEGEGIVVFLIK